MDIKEEIHALSEEMLTNLGRLVAIDSQLGTPSEGKPFGEGPAKALEEGLKIAEELGFKTVNLDNYCGTCRNACRPSYFTTLWYVERRRVTGSGRDCGRAWLHVAIRKGAMTNPFFPFSS